MKNIIKYIFLFHLLMFCAWAYPSTYTLRGLSVSDGLSDLLVNAIYKDSLGFVWIGTGNSLSLFRRWNVRTKGAMSQFALNRGMVVRIVFYPQTTRRTFAAWGI